MPAGSLEAEEFLRFQATCRQPRGCIIPQAVTQSLVLLKMGVIIARNMLSWFKLLINRYCCISLVFMSFTSMMHGEANIRYTAVLNMTWLWTGLNWLNIMYCIGIFENWHDSSGSIICGFILPLGTNPVIVLNRFAILTYGCSFHKTSLWVKL